MQHQYSFPALQFKNCTIIELLPSEDTFPMFIDPLPNTNKKPDSKWLFVAT